MGRLIDIKGKRFGRLLILNKVKAKNKAGAYWLCVCDCGNKTIVHSGNLRLGHTKSCGCLKKDNPPNYKHGKSQIHDRTYRTWIGMRQRCNNLKSNGYKNYGGRGIKICERWHNFENFFSDMGERPQGKSINRINNDGNYEPDNCEWATQKQQRRNSRKTKLSSENIKETRKLRISGKSFSEIAKKYNVSSSTIYNALRGITWS